MAPLTDAAKMIQEAEESGKSLLEVSLSHDISIHWKVLLHYNHLPVWWQTNSIQDIYTCIIIQPDKCNIFF